MRLIPLSHGDIINLNRAGHRGSALFTGINIAQTANGCRVSPGIWLSYRVIIPIEEIVSGALASLYCGRPAGAPRRINVKSDSPEAFRIVVITRFDRY